MTEWKKNSVHRLTVEGYSSEGMGVARLDGRVVFVQRAVAGEICDVQLMKVLKNCAYGCVAQLVTPSPARQEPDCPWFGRCGGCDFRHLRYDEELRAKRQRVQDALTRLGGSDVEVEEILGAAQPLHYRNKSQYPVSAEGTVGFYRARSHQVVPVDRCLIQHPAADAAAAAVAEWMKTWQVPGYDEKTRKGLLRHIYVRVNQAGESLCCLLVNGDALPREQELVKALRAAVPGLTGVVLGRNTRPGNVILGDSYRTLWGQDFLMDTLRGFTFRLSVPSFYQVNHDQAEVLYGKALEFAALTGQETVLDLYCGIGTITLCLAAASARAIGAEIVPEAIADAKENAARNGVENVSFFCADAGDIAARLAEEGLRPDVVTVDPPRKGLAPEVIASIVEMAPDRVVYVSCDPGTLGRDVKLFGQTGYRLIRAAAVDMFPGTRHVETVVLLSKGEIDSKKVRVEFSLEDMDMSGFQKGATYEQIKTYVLEHTGLKVSSLYISQIKRKCGLDVGQNYNLSKKEDAKVPQCPPEKEAAIMEALKYFQMI